MPELPADTTNVDLTARKVGGRSVEPGMTTRHGGRDWIIAIVAAVVGALATKGVDLLAAAMLPWWSYLVGASVALIVLTLALHDWRKQVWGRVGMWRPLTTVAKLDAVRSQAYRLGFEAGEARAAERERQVGRDEVRALIQAERADIPVVPVWAVTAERPDVGNNTSFMLVNSQSGADVREVILEAPKELFAFSGDSRFSWSTVVSAKQFTGARTREGRKAGVMFAVKWRDANNDWHDDTAWLDSYRPVPTVFS